MSSKKRGKEEDDAKDMKALIIVDSQFLRDPKANTSKKSVKQQFGTKATNLLWILDSISQYELADRSDYVLEEGDE